MIPNNGRPGDVRGFLHKKIFGAVGGAVKGFIGGGPIGAISGAVGSFIPKPTQQFQQPAPIRQVTSRGCPPGMAFDARGNCVQAQVQVPIPGIIGGIQRLLPGGKTGFEAPSTPTTAVTVAPQEFGDAVMGRFGAALEPAVRSSSVRVCPRGTVLGIDGLCYNKRDIRNADREWPRGRRPLLTGGEMRCISIAAGAAKRLQKKQKQLEALGMLKKPSRRAAPKQLGPGHHAHVAHD
jgi:hypothetical protein